MSRSRFTLEDLSRKSPAIQAQVKAALEGTQGAVLPAQAARSPVRRTPTSPQPPNQARKRARVPRVRNGGKWTEAEFWGAVRGCLRRIARFWKPAQVALLAARIPYKGSHGQKWAYRCADCQRLFKRKGVQVDHVVPCGVLTSLEHLPGFLERMTPESPEAYKVRCLSCHQTKTNAERAALKACP